MQEAQAHATQQVEAIALAVGALFGGKKSSGIQASADAPRPQTADELASGLTNFFSAMRN